MKDFDVVKIQHHTLNDSDDTNKFDRRCEYTRGYCNRSTCDKMCNAMILADHLRHTLLEPRSDAFDILREKIRVL